MTRITGYRRMWILAVVWLVVWPATPQAGGGEKSASTTGENAITYSLRWMPASDRAGQAVTDARTGFEAVSAFAAAAPVPISTGRAVLYSLLLPGLGDYAMGNQTRAWTFFGVEAGLWTAFAVSRVQGARREDAYEDYAVRFAGIARTGHSDDYYALLREYDSSVEYEALIKADGRAELWPPFDPNGQDPRVGKEALDAYFIENRIGDYEPWAWQSLEHKIQFQETRSASKNAYRRSTFLIAAAAANRIVAAVFAYTSSRRRASGEVSTRRYQLDFTPPGTEFATAVTLVRRF